MDPFLSYINHCTAHYSSVLFWIQFCLDQIKVIARAHPCHHFHHRYLKIGWKEHLLKCGQFPLVGHDSVNGEKPSAVGHLVSMKKE
jgi:hypothetical protein